MVNYFKHFSNTMVAAVKNFIKRIFPYNIWHFLISNYQSYKFLLFGDYSARGNIDLNLVNILKKKKKRIFFRNWSI